LILFEMDASAMYCMVLFGSKNPIFDRRNERVHFEVHQEYFGMHRTEFISPHEWLSNKELSAVPVLYLVGIYIYI